MFENILISNILVKKYICFYETDGVMNSKPSNHKCAPENGLGTAKIKGVSKFTLKSKYISKDII